MFTSESSRKLRSIRQTDYQRIQRAEGISLEEATSTRRGERMAESSTWWDAINLSRQIHTEKDVHKKLELEDLWRNEIRSGRISIGQAIDINNFVEDRLGIKKEQKEFIGNCLPWEY